jgi:uncharacterized protein (TIGR02001 family)
MLLIAPARAQVSGSATLVSDYRFRGISLSDERPALQLAVAYDHASGLYAGAMASSARPDADSGSDVHLLPYLGFARRMDSGLGWDVGIAYAAFVEASGYDYPEVHVGVNSEHLGARLSFAHRYFGDDADAIYLELNADRPVSDRVRLLAHLGWLHHDTTDESFPGLQRQHLDLRVGVGIDVAGCDLQIAWVSSDGEQASYASSPEVDHSALIASLSRAW